MGKAGEPGGDLQPWTGQSSREQGNVGVDETFPEDGHNGHKAEKVKWRQIGRITKSQRISQTHESIKAMALPHGQARTLALLQDGEGDQVQAN